MDIMFPEFGKLWLGVPRYHVDMRQSFADAPVILCIYDNEYARGYLFRLLPLIGCSLSKVLQLLLSSPLFTNFYPCIYATVAILNLCNIAPHCVCVFFVLL